MIPIFAALDAFTESYSDEEKKLWGWVELMYRTNSEGGRASEQPIPVTINNTSDRQQVSLDDRYRLITWFRIPGTIELGNEVDGNDWAFGLNQGFVQRAGVRWVIAHRVEMGDGWIFDFLRALPNDLEVADYQVVHLDKLGTSVDFDHETIYNTELGRTVYEKHRFTWNIYVINLPIEFIPCSGARFPEVCTGAFITEDGECLTPE